MPLTRHWSRQYSIVARAAVAAGRRSTASADASQPLHHYLFSNQQQQQQQQRSHYTYSGPGSYNQKNRRALQEQLWQQRDFDHRGFTVGIGGPVGSGKTHLVQALCHQLQKTSTTQLKEVGPAAVQQFLQVGVVTNDIFTQEDAEFLVRNDALPAQQVKAVETGGCPHAAIREDVSANLSALEELTAQLLLFGDGDGCPTILLCESGGDNLAANFSHELADLTIYVIDVAAGDKVPRKGGPGITQSDLLLINKIDLADAVGADLGVMQRDAARMRGDDADSNNDDDDDDDAAVGLTVFGSVKNGTGMAEIVDFILGNYQRAMALSSSSSSS